MINLSASKMVAILLAILLQQSSGYTKMKPLPYHIAARADAVTTLIQMILTNIHHQLPKGLPALGIPPLDPLEVGGLHVDESPIDALLGLDGDLWNINVTGASNFDVNLLKFSILPKPHLQLTLTWPLLAVTGQYDLRGNFTRDNGFSGKGPFSIRAETVTFTADVLLFLKGLTPGIEHVNLDLTVKTMVANFQGISGGETEENATNRILSSLLEHTFETKIRPQVVKAGETLKEILKSLLGSL